MPGAASAEAEEQPGGGMKILQTVDMGGSAAPNWRVGDPLISTTMMPKACLAFVNGLCSLYAIVLAAKILLAGFWLKSLEIETAIAEAPAYSAAVRNSINAWLTATVFGAFLFLAAAYVRSV